MFCKSGKGKEMPEYYKDN